MSEGSELLNKIMQDSRNKKEIATRELYDDSDSPGFFNFPSFLKKIHQFLVSFFNESKNNAEVLNANIGKILIEVRNIPGLHEDLRKSELDNQIKDSEISDLNDELKELKAELSLKDEVLNEIKNKDYMGLMNQYLLEMTKAMRDGRDPDYTELSDKFNVLKEKVKGIL